MNKFKKIMLGALSALTLGLFVVTGSKVLADTSYTTYTADFKSGSLVNSTAGYFTAAKGSSSYSSSSNCTATFTSIINGESYSDQNGCKMESSTTITFTTTATSVSTVTILWGANVNAETDVNFDGSASSTKTAANKTNAVSETWTNVAAGSHTIGRGASGNQAVIFEVKVVEAITQETGTYTVTYNNNGHGTAQDAVPGSTALPDELPELSETGYIFDGWYYDNNTFENEANAGDAISTNTTLYAKWSKNNAEWCTITFNANGGTCSTSTAEAVFGSTYTLPTATKENYALTGWSDGTTTHKGTYTVPSESTATLTAQWISTDITVYDSNVLTNGMINELYTSSIITDTKITEQFDINDSIYSVLNNDSIVADKKTISSELGDSSHAIKSGGQFNNAKNGLGINAPSAGKLTVYARVNGTNTYKGQLFNSSYTKIDETENTATSAAVVAFEFDIDAAGQYYFGNTAGGFYIYYASFVVVPTTEIYWQTGTDSNNKTDLVRVIGVIENVEDGFANIDNVTLTYTKSGASTVTTQTITTLYTAIMDGENAYSVGNVSFGLETGTYYVVFVFDGYEAFHEAKKSMDITINVYANGNTNPITATKTIS